MNLSGEVIKDFINYFKIEISNMLVIHDDLDLELGNYKLKYKGGSGGHNGLKNIEQNLNSNEYKRLKIGISNNKNIDTKDYILGEFASEEKKIIDRVTDIAVDIFDDYCKLTFDNLMNKYNQKDDTISIFFYLDGRCINEFLRKYLKASKNCEILGLTNELKGLYLYNKFIKDNQAIL